jgi:hypothetical protein
VLRVASVAETTAAELLYSGPTPPRIDDACAILDKVVCLLEQGIAWYRDRTGERSDNEEVDVVQRDNHIKTCHFITTSAFLLVLD